MLNFLKTIISFDKEAKQESNLKGIEIYPKRCLRLEQKNVLCHICVQSCPKEAIDLRKSVKVIYDKCNKCGACIEICPAGVFAFPNSDDDSQISRRDFFKRFRTS